MGNFDVIENLDCNQKDTTPALRQNTEKGRRITQEYGDLLAMGST
jgi:hypothetical protein